MLPTISTISVDPELVKGLQQIKKFLDDGTFSQKEFDKQKSALLDAYGLQQIKKILDDGLSGTSGLGSNPANREIKKKCPDVRPDENLTSGVRRQPHPT
jgi:hypothetical protein